MDLKAADELLTTTRSVRKRLDLARPVPPEILEECIDVALQAPSGSNQQSWHWVVVTDPAKRAAIGEIYRQQFDKYEASRGFAGRLYADRPDRAQVQQRVGSSARWLGDRFGLRTGMVLVFLTLGYILSVGFWAKPLVANATVPLRELLRRRRGVPEAGGRPYTTEPGR